MVNNLTRATVTYQPKETTEGGTPAAVEAAAPQVTATRQPVATQQVAPQMTRQPAATQPVAPTAEAHATLDTRMIPLQRTPVGK